MERNSGVKFSEAQVALARQWVAGDMLTTQREITLSLPREETGLETGAEGDKPTTLKVHIPVDSEAARHVVEQFQQGAHGVRSDELVADNVVQHRLQDNTSLLEEKWLGTEEEELNAWVILSFCVNGFY
jgi:phospholipase D1/2